MATTHDPLGSAAEKLDNAGINPDKIKEQASQMKDKIADAAGHLKDTASEYGRSAVDQIDRNVRGAAGALESTAQTLRSQGTGAGGRVSEFAETAASKLESTAGMLKQYDTRQLFSQFESWTRNNPGLAIGGALAIGFFIGMSLKRDDRA